MSSCTISCIAAVRKPEAHPPTDSDGKSGICLIYCSTECGDIFDVTSTPNRLALPRTRAEKGAYDRLAAVKFREHKCEAETRLSPAKQETKLSAAATAFAERARVLITEGCCGTGTSGNGSRTRQRSEDHGEGACRCRGFPSESPQGPHLRWDYRMNPGISITAQEERRERSCAAAQRNRQQRFWVEICAPASAYLLPANFTGGGT